MAGGARGGKRQGVTDLVAGGYVREFWDPVMNSERPAGFIISTGSIGLWVYLLERQNSKIKSRSVVYLR